MVCLCSFPFFCFYIRLGIHLFWNVLTRGLQTFDWILSWAHDFCSWCHSIKIMTFTRHHCLAFENRINLRQMYMLMTYFRVQVRESKNKGKSEVRKGQRENKYIVMCYGNGHSIQRNHRRLLSVVGWPWGTIGNLGFLYSLQRGRRKISLWPESSVCCSNCVP